MVSAESAILTIGYGHRDIEEFIGLLERHGIRYLGDVRSRTTSGYNPDFSANRLKAHLREADITYVWLGDTLGGDPGDSNARISTSRGEGDTYLVDYARLREEPRFAQGMERLRTAWRSDVRLVLMCSEAKPEQCHRVRLIGEALTDEQIPVRHIDENGVLRSQRDIMLRIDKGQSTLPGFGPSPKSTRSSRTWKSRESA